MENLIELPNYLHHIHIINTTVSWLSILGQMDSKLLEITERISSTLFKNAYNL